MDFSKMSFGAQLALFLVLGALSYGAFHWLIYSGMQQEIERKEADRQTLSDEVEAGKLTAAKLPEFKREVERREAQLQTLSRILPSSKEVDDLLRKVQALAAQSNLSVLRFKPEATQPVDFYARWPITLELDGTYHNLAYFFDRLSKLSRIVNVSGLRIAANRTPTAASTIRANCTATTFVFIEQAAAAPAAQGRGGRNQRNSRQR
ncbi:MAG TPA: type 4a pilus biogenesis protein PilO [Vicinamibacteria bacterium]|jgi:type IV pilus assembly protein PilO